MSIEVNRAAFKLYVVGPRVELGDPLSVLDVAGVAALHDGRAKVGVVASVSDIDAHLNVAALYIIQVELLVADVVAKTVIPIKANELNVEIVIAVGKDAVGYRVVDGVGAERAAPFVG